MPVNLARVFFVSACLATGLHPVAFGADIWTNSSGGLWKEPTNWSARQAPNLGLGSTFITNANNKVVIVDSSTPPTNLVINALTVSGPANTTNTLQLLDLGLNNPLIVSNNSFNIYRGGALSVTNSALVVTGRFLSFNLWMGSVTLDSGSIIVREEPLTTNVTVFTRIGRTNAASLAINGGTMQASSLLIGESPDIQFGRSHGTVKISGGQLSIAGELSIGESLMCTGVVEVTGGQLVAANNGTNITRVGDYGMGQLTVSNSVALLNNVSVARHDGSLGNLTVLTNGFVGCSDDLSIGRFSGANGTVVVAGGQLIVTNHPIWVGREGVGQLNAFDGLVQAESLHVAVVPTNTARGTVNLYGGTVLISSNAILGDASISTGQVFMAAGDLVVTNDSNSANLMVASGDLTVNGGTITADNLLLTNLAGQLPFNGGTLRTKSTRVSNGLPFVVGDGTKAATLHLLGGTHSFADGLIISSNSTLTGCGTIIGTIVNYGTLATNCGGGTPVPPSITQQPTSLTITQGNNASFMVIAGGDPPLSYQWRFNGNDLADATSASLTITNAQAADAGNYDVVVLNNVGSVTSAVATLTVLTPPLITQQPQDQTVPEGTDATFSVTASGSPPLFYQWQSNGVEVITATNASLIVSNALLAQGGEMYRVVVTNAAGSVTSDPATLFVAALPTWTITTQPQSRTVVAGTNVSFNVSANGTPPLTYQWRFNGADILAATNSSLTLTNVQPVNEGAYDAVVYDAGGSSRTSRLASLTVLVPPTITQPPQSQSVVVGSNITFTVVAGGTAPLSYEWRFNDSALPDQTNATLTLTNVQAADAGIYTAVVSNSAGSVTTDPATLRVLVRCTVTFVSRSESASTLSFSTASGLTYTVEYKNSLADANWTSLVPAVTGTGTEMTVQDTPAGVPARYYRVRIE